MHHKEIALKVDTAKLILATFPHPCRLVIGGIGPEYQETMQEMMDAITETPHRCLLLFPDDAAQTCRDLLHSNEDSDNDDFDSSDSSTTIDQNDTVDGEWDLIVLDGTWVQARKFCQRYFPQEGGPRKVQLSEEAVQNLDATVQGEEKTNNISGHQLRRHAISWRQIGTFEATRLFLKDFDWAIHHHCRRPDKTCDVDQFWDSLQKYQDIANLAAQRELGPPRVNR